MSQQPQKHKNSMYEQKTQEIISSNDGKPTTRTARFLKPLANQTTTFVTSFPKTPFLYELFAEKNQKKWPFEVHFSGWKKPKTNWAKWYYKLVVKHGTTWLKCGILDAIHTSMHRIPCNKELVYGVCEFWRKETNTFVFPWGEATVTLEDVMVLGGFPLLGGSVYKEVRGELVRVVDGLVKAKAEICNAVGSRGRVTHSSWMRHFMEEEEEEEEEEGEFRGHDGEEGEFEHTAFLALWLSRFVFPSVRNESLVKNYVFPIAAHLSKGTPICIAPIVLANLYCDMSLLADMASDDPCFVSKRVSVSGLFQIVQMWVCERFPVFAEKLAKPLSLGDPRAARWDSVEVKVKLGYVRSRLMLGTGFRWRPYADGLENWEILPFYEENEQVLDDFMDFPCSDMPSYGWFCKSCVLVGVKGKEEYNPHRVAMQFGFDQDLPGEMDVSETSVDQVGFWVPSRNFHPGMTRRYYDWWKESMSSRKDTVSKALRRKSSEEHGQKIVSDQKNVERSSDFPQRIPVSPVGDAPVKLDIRPITENLLRKHQPSSVDEWEIPELPGIPKTIVLVSPRELESNCRESHASVSPPSSFMLQRSTPQNEDLDHVPLASRICNKIATTKKDTGDGMTRQRSRSLNNKSVISVVTKHHSSNFHDIDHVPLAQRLEAIMQREGTPKPIESHASTVHVRNSHRRQLPPQTEELVSPISDVFSQITRKRRSSLQRTINTDNEIKDNVGSSRAKERKEALEVRVSKLEKVIAKLGVVQSDPDSSDSS
ncbi:hypothetical protein vseg_007484 [Gypsophila vaccaria]